MFLTQTIKWRMVMKKRVTNMFLLVALGVISISGFFLASMDQAFGQSEDTVYLACIDDFSGPFASSGKAYLQGIQLALKDAGYKVLGKKIELVTRDTELKPPVGVRRLREVVQKYHPFFVFQSESSSVGLAMEQEALNLKTPIFIEGFATQITGDECNRYTFRWDASNYAGARSGLAAFLKLHPKVKSFYAIVDNNASGKSMLEEQEAILSSHGGKILKTTFTPLGNADYSSHLTEALSLNPDALIFNNYGTGNMNVSKQIHEFGISKKIPVLGGFGGLDMLRGMPPEAPEGIFYGVNWWHTVDNDWTKNFVSKFKKEYGEVPSYISASGYIGAWLVLQTAEKVKSLKAKDLIIGLEQFGSFEGPSGMETLQPWDHQVVHPFILGKGKAVKDKKDSDDYLDVVGSAAVYPNTSLETSACKFKTKDEEL